MAQRARVLDRLWSAAVPLLLLTVLFWAGNSIVARAMRDAVPPFTLALIRWAGALALLLPFALKHIGRDIPKLRVHWPIVLLLGLLGVAGFNAFLYHALRHSTATNALLLQSATPAVVLLFGWLLFRDKAGPLRIAAVSVAMAGVVTVAARGDADVLMSLRFGRGDPLVLMAVLVWAAYTVLLRLKPAVHPLSFLLVTFIIGALAMLPLSLWELDHEAPMRLDTGAALGLAYVAVFPSLVAYLLYNRGVELIGGARAGQFTNFMPLFGALLAAPLLGEPLHGYHWIGGALILAGTLLFMRTK